MSTQEQRLLDCIRNVWEKIAPSGTLQTWLPYHALAAYENRPFKDAVKEAYADIFVANKPEAIEQINRCCVQFLGLFFDEKQAVWKLPGRSNSLYNSILSLYRYQAYDISKTEKALSLKPIDLISYVLHSLEIQDKDYDLFIERLLLSLPGWASYIRYKVLEKKDYGLGVDFIALRCFWAFEYGLNPKELLQRPTQDTPTAINSLLKNEIDIADVITESLSGEQNESSSHSEKILAHFVFCIDTRSGPIREALQQAGPYTTDGMAGFWGLDVALFQKDSSVQYNLCPALLEPTQKIQTISTQEGFFLSWANAVRTLESRLKKHPLTLLIWVECFGVICGIWAIILSFGLFSQPKKQKATQKNWDLASDAYLQIPLKERVRYATNFINNLSCETIPPLLIICGHGATTLNNIFAAKLQCGACGNYRGIENARLMAQILRCRQTQAQLPWDLSSTDIIAAEHETVSDRILFEPVLDKVRKTPHFQQLLHALEKVRYDNYQRRIRLLQQKDGAQLYHWAQLRPEWGLAGHQALIIGPNWWGKKLSQNGNVFRHSYHPSKDAEYLLLNAIFQGPVNVAYLLNMQYLFPSLQPELFAAGNKMLHQLTMLCMAVQGNGSDLMIGLPEQSVQYSKGNLYHKPARLLIVVYAPLHAVSQVLLSQKTLYHKFLNEWLLLRVYDPDKNAWLGLDDIITAAQAYTIQDAELVLSEE